MPVAAGGKLDGHDASRYPANHRGSAAGGDVVDSSRETLRETAIERKRPERDDERREAEPRHEQRRQTAARRA
jgi:hypothetical protein